MAESEVGAGYLCVLDDGLGLFRARAAAEKMAGGAGGVAEVNAAAHLRQWPASGWSRFTRQDQSYPQLCRELANAGLAIY